MGIFSKSNDKEIEVDAVTKEEEKIKKSILHLLKKKNTEILVLSLSGRFIISNNTGDTSVNILVDGVAELIKMKVSKNGVQISSFIDVTSKSTIAKLRGSFVDQIIKVIIVWIDKDRYIREKALFDETTTLDYVHELIDNLSDLESEKDTELKKSLI
jgi:hypothetical protein